MPPCTSLPPAPVTTRRQTNPAAQPPSTATTYGRAGNCRAGLPRQSRRTFFSAWATALRPAQADQHQRLADLSRRFRRIYKTSPMPVRRPPRAAERRYLRKIRRLRVFRTASIRRREKAGLQLPLFYDRCELPDIARADRGSRPEYDAPVRARQWLRTLRSGYPRQGAICWRRCGGTPFASIGESRDCFRGTGYSLIEEVCVFQDGRPVPIKRNGANF